MQEEKRPPHRTCVGCRKIRERNRLIRVVSTPEGALVPDFKAKLPGRGAYLCCSSACIQEAVRKRAIPRALKRPIESAEVHDLGRKVRDALDTRVLSLIGVLRKARKVVAGRDAIRKSLGRCEVYLLIQASDAEGPLTGRHAGPLSVRTPFSRERLGKAVGKGPQPLLGVLDEGGGKEILRMIDMKNSLASSGGEMFYGEA